MRALIVYESMYGNTHVVADHIADGIRSHFETEVVPVEQATAERMQDIHLLVVGGPTHVHSLSSEKSRQAAVAAAQKPDADVSLDPDAEGEGLREWFHHAAEVTNLGAAAFDTRIDAAAWLTGRASKGIGRRLTHLGYDLVADPESFLVDKENHLIAGEAERAVAWGAALALSLAANP
jgi:Flavodoxin domain